VVCVDELGPLGCSVYPAKRPYPAKHRPIYQPDYGGKGKTWVFGALAVASGQALTHTASTRCASDFIAFLEQLIQLWPQGQLVLILDNLSVHRSREVQLWLLSQPRLRFLFQPTYSPWLNLIEPWWKTLRSLALKGTAFDAPSALASAISAATSYWNTHKHPFVWRTPNSAFLST
jgi:transposase